MNRKYTDEERFQLDIPPEQEDTRAEDEYNQEGILYNDLSRIIARYEEHGGMIYNDLNNTLFGYWKHGVFKNYRTSVAFVLRALLEKIEKGMKNGR